MRRKAFLELLSSVVLVSLAIVAVYAPNWAFVRKGAEFTVQIMLAYLVLGLIFLTISQKRLLFVSFFCCGALCLFLKQSSNSHLRLPETSNNEKVSVAHFNTSAASEAYTSLIEVVRQTDADIYSFQEVTPDWEIQLKQALSSTHPYMVSNVRIDPYGMAIFSKRPINTYDTFHYKEIPHQLINIPVSEENCINLINAHVLPPLSQRLNEKTKEHLNKIAEKINTLEGPSIVLGDFNLVYWSNEIRNFRSKAKLDNSRRDVSKNLLNIPYDHIFFSETLECTNFKDILDTASNHMGISGTYELREIIDVKQSRMPSFFE